MKLSSANDNITKLLVLKSMYSCLIIKLLVQEAINQPPFYDHYTSQPALANWRILLVQSFTAHMPLLTATSAFGLGRRCWSSPQQCYLHCLCTRQQLEGDLVATCTDH